MDFKFLKNIISTVVTKKATANIQKAVQPVKKQTVYIQHKETVNKSETSVKNDTPVVTEPKGPDYSGLCVVLDPGHAKSTPGKRSPYSAGKQSTPALPLEEWKFNREIVRMLQTELEKYNIDTFVTTTSEQDGDNDVKLTVRAQRGYNFIKKENKSGMFISIHADAHGYGDAWTSANGWSVYTTKGQTISDEFANMLYDEAEKTFKPLGKKLRTDKTDGDRDCESNFTVIYKTEQLSMKNGKVTVPAVLVENFFYTNASDTEYISSDKGKKDIVNVIINAILKYAEIKKIVK